MSNRLGIDHLEKEMHMSQPIDSASPMPGGLTRRQFVRAVAAAALATTVPAALTACGSKGAAGTITVGSKDFTEG